MYWVYYVTRETPCHNRKRYSIRFTAIAGKRFQIDFGDVNISIIQPFNSLYGFILFIFLFSFCPPFISLCDTLSPILVWIHAKRRLETINKQNQIYSKGTREPHVTRRHSFIVIVAGVQFLHRKWAAVWCDNWWWTAALHRLPTPKCNPNCILFAHIQFGIFLARIK